MLGKIYLAASAVFGMGVAKIILRPIIKPRRGVFMAGMGTIIIADRNRNVRDLLRREFELEGFRVKTAGNGEELILMAHKDEAADLVVMDLDLPLLSGEVLLQSFEKSRPAIPVVVHSNQVAPHDLKRFPCVVACIEKGESLESLDQLKKTVFDIIKKTIKPDPGPS
jgi:DNA-binding NtrC family response regulator